MNRGSWARINKYTARMTRFNEAPIHESGKFNEAYAESTKRIEASMRPRFMNRGSGSAADRMAGW